ncbi:MAG: glycosyltransferase involved in cell wall biosynthesis [Bacteroidia bacterium]
MLKELLLIVFLASAGVQFVYWLLFLITIIFHKKESSVSKNDKPGVSIIICAYNEIGNLKQLLPALYKQDYSNVEIIIVNDRSTDGSYEFLLEESKSSPKLTLITIDKSPDHIDSKKYAISLGVKAANFNRLLFTDADCLPESDKWVSSMSNGFADNKEFVIGYSQFKKEDSIVNMFSRFETQITGMLYNSFAIAGNPYMAVGRNLGYLRSTFLKNKGFNQFQKITGGDDDLLVNHYATKSNSNVCFGREALVWSYSKKSFSDYYKQKLRHISVSKYYKAKDKFLLSMYSSSHLCFWIAFVILASSKHFTELMLGILAFRLIFNSLVVNHTSKKFGERIVVWIVPIMDLIYNPYLIIMGIAALSTKKVKWN